MLIVECEGTPYQIGYAHGSKAKIQVHGSKAFYEGLFLKNCLQTWPQVLGHAEKFEEQARAAWPAYHEEMRGIADGAGVELLDIVALNVRTEINFGLFSDGCTALSWHTRDRAFLAQNWDWSNKQKKNLIITAIRQDGKPNIQQVTEAGIIGKIGFNSAGVGTLLNAIRVHGVDPKRLPVHFALRMVLESDSTQDAVDKLKHHGIASSAHILIADPNKAVGLEFTKSTFAECAPDGHGRIVHTNHLLLEHPHEIDTVWLKDSPSRMETMSANVRNLSAEPSWEQVSRLFEDETHFPTSICREETPESGSGTLFNIVMDLKSKRVVVRLGKPTRVEETISLSF